MQAIKAQTEARIAELEAAVQDHAGSPVYIVECQRVYMKFDIAANGSVTNPRMPQPENATRLSRINAEHIAQTVQNGNGTKGTAMRLIDALTVELEEQQKLLAAVVKYLEKA